MNINDQINKNVTETKRLLAVIDNIPKSFSSLNTSIGVNRDILEDSFSNIQQSLETIDHHEGLSILTCFNSLLISYVQLYSHYIGKLIFKCYVDPSSSSDIIDIIGSKGVSFNDQGVFVFNPNHGLTFKVNKGEWVVSNSKTFIKIDDLEKKKYDNFLKS